MQSSAADQRTVSQAEEDLVSELDEFARAQHIGPVGDAHPSPPADSQGSTPARWRRKTTRVTNNARGETQRGPIQRAAAPHTPAAGSAQREPREAPARSGEQGSSWELALCGGRPAGELAEVIWGGLSRGRKLASRVHAPPLRCLDEQALTALQSRRVVRPASGSTCLAAAAQQVKRRARHCGSGPRQRAPHLGHAYARRESARSHLVTGPGPQANRTKAQVVSTPAGSLARATVSAPSPPRHRSVTRTGKGWA